MTLPLLQILVAALPLSGHARLGLSRQPFVVQLRKEHARGNKSSDTVKDHGGGFFVGPIQLGGPAPQELRVIFSTTTGMISVPSASCSSAACQEHHRYSPRKSESSMDIQRDGQPVDPAGGRFAPEGAPRDTVNLGFYTTGDDNSTGLGGNLVTETLCLGDRLGNTGVHTQPVCTKVTMVVATTVQEKAFRARPEDGMVGLSLLGLSIEPHFNVLHRMSGEGLPSQFGFFAEDDARNAELVFGGYDRGKLESKLEWVPVAAPEMGHWLVNIVGIQLGGRRLNMCRQPLACRGLIDTSSPGIMMPTGLLNSELKDMILPPDQSGAASRSCSLPDLSIELEGGVVLTLRMEDYAGPRCEPEIRPHNLGKDIVDASLFLLGEPVLRRYYTVFDWGKKQLGFARAKVERSCQRLSAAWVPTDGYGCSGPSGELQDSIMFLSNPEDYDLRFHTET